MQNFNVNFTKILTVSSCTVCMSKLTRVDFKDNFYLRDHIIRSNSGYL
jgi:hypothetical protein